MFVKKETLTSIIQKERKKEFERCSKEYAKQIKTETTKLESQHAAKIKDVIRKYDNLLKQKDVEINTLKDEIHANYRLYQELRSREISLDALSHDFEAIIHEMNIKIQESIQPFYRVLSKTEGVKRLSDKKNHKIESVFKAM